MIAQIEHLCYTEFVADATIKPTPPDKSKRPAWNLQAGRLLSPPSAHTLSHPVIRVPQVPLTAPGALVGHHRLATGAEPPPGGPGVILVAVGDLAHALPAPDLALAAHGMVTRSNVIAQTHGLLVQV